MVIAVVLFLLSLRVVELCDFFYFVKFVFRAVARVGVSETLDVGCFHSILVLGGTGSILCVLYGIVRALNVTCIYYTYQFIRVRILYT